jgi:hypothetical protein
MALNSEKIKCIYMALKSTFSPLIYHKNKRKQEQIGIIIPVITVLWAIVSQELLKKTQSSIEKKEKSEFCSPLFKMGNFWTRAAKWSLLNKKEIDEDWATKSNWICNDQLCPNPYTHARGDPCKLTMEDLFPSRPEPPTSEDTKQPEDDSEDWLIEWDRENKDRENK